MSTKWEYQEVFHVSEFSLSDELNNLGSDGWEVYHLEISSKTSELPTGLIGQVKFHNIYLKRAK